MAAYKLTTTSLSASTWRNMKPEIAPGMLLSIEAVTDTYARRIVARAKRRFELAMNPMAPVITNEDTYIAGACQVAFLKGFCFVAADEIAQDLTARGAPTKCVRVEPKGGGGDHYFAVVNKGSVSTSLIVDPTWLQFWLNGAPFCLAGTLAKLTSTLQTSGAPQLIDAYKAGLKVVNQWGAYLCFS
jgi:hypothetical protein